MFAKAPDFGDARSATFHFENTIINLENESSAHELIPPIAVADQATGSRVVFTIWVDDVDAACAELPERGVTLINSPVDRPWGTRTACFADPGGHIWEIAQELEQQPGS